MANSVPLDNCPGASPRKDRWCKAVACAVDLHDLGRPYCLKKGLCPEHMKANAVRLEGGGDQLWRFCQQCGKLEPLSCFKQGMRSCRKGLAKRRQNLASRQERQQPEHEYKTHSPQPAAKRSAFATAYNPGSAEGLSMDCTASEHDSIGRTGSSNTTCSNLKLLAAAAAAGSPGIYNSHQQQQVLLQQLAGNAVGLAGVVPVADQSLLLRQQLSGDAWAAAAHPGKLMLQQQHLHQPLPTGICHGSVQQQVVLLLPQILPGSTAAAAVSNTLLMQQQQQQQNSQIYMAAGMPMLLPMAAAGPTLATYTSSDGLNPASIPVGCLDPSAPSFEQLDTAGMQGTPARMSSTGSSGFAGLVKQESVAAAVPASLTGLTGECPATAAATAAGAATGPAGLSEFAELHDWDCSAEAGPATAFAIPGLPFTEAELDALIDEELQSARMQLDTTAAAAAPAAAGTPLPGPAAAALTDSGGSSGSLQDRLNEGWSGGAGPGGYALLNDSQLDGIIEQEMLALGMLVPAGSGGSGFELAGALSCTADIPHLQPALRAPATTAATPELPGSAALSALHAPTTAPPVAAFAPAGMAAAAAAGGVMEPLMTEVITQAQPLPAAAAAATTASAVAPSVVPGLPQVPVLPPTASMGDPPAAAAQAMAAAAAAGQAMVPPGAAGLLHAAQYARLDALISELVDLRSTMRQQQQQQQPHGVLHGRVVASRHSPGSMADTSFYNSL